MSTLAAGTVVLSAVSAADSSSTVQADEGPNLLTNPGCDADDGSGSPPDGWSLVSSNVQCTDPATVGDPTPPDGSDAFVDFSQDDSDGIVEQEVDVSGGAEYNLGGEAGRGSGTSDYVEVEVEYLNENGDEISGGTTVESKPASGTYESFEETTVAPEDAATAVVRVTLVDVDDTSYSDAYLNEVEFREVTSGVAAFPVSGVETGVEQTLDPSWTLHDDDYAEQGDDLGSEPADLVSFGGGDLGGDATEHDAGANVSLAGGHLQVNADGSYELTNPTQTGTFTFDYRIEDSSSSDEASVEITVDDNTLHNPGCEETDTDSNPMGWAVATGSMTCLDLDEDDDTSHSSIDATSFAADIGGDAEAEQTVFVVPGEEYTLEGYYGTDDGDDDGEVVVEYLDENGDVITGEGMTLSDLQSDSTTEFDQFSDSAVAPSGARRATIRLSMNHVDAGTYAGVYFDDLSFERLDPAPDAKDVDGLSVDIDETLAESVLDDHGDGTDYLGDPQAEVVGFGGGDLDGETTAYDAGETASLAGGELTVASDGTLQLEDHTKAGTYTFDYRLENEAGSDDATVTVTVEDTTPPTADAGSDLTVDEDTALSFDGSESTDNGAIDSYEWEFGDGKTATGATPSHTYADPRTYTVDLTVTDTAGNEDTDTVEVTVRDVTPPTADAGGDRIVASGQQLDFDGSGSTDNVDVTGYEWDFGDGATDTGKTVTHTFGAADTYDVSLTAADDAGNTDTDTATVTVTDGVPIDTCTTIDVPGKYVLTDDLERDETCLEITASDVHLDGNGYTVTSTASENEDAGIIVDGSAGELTNVSVENVTLVDWDGGSDTAQSDGNIDDFGQGLALDTVSESVVSNVTATGAYVGVYLNEVEDVTVTDSTFGGSEDAGIGLRETADSTIHNTTVTDAGRNGIEADGVTATRIANNSVEGSQRGGIVLLGDSGAVTVDRNTVTDSDGSAIEIDVDDVPSVPFEIAGNELNATGSQMSALYARSSGRANVTGNTVVAGANGIYVQADDSRVEDNDVRNSAYRGVYLSGADGGVVEGNDITSIDSTGVEISNTDGTAVRDNEIAAAGDHGVEVRTSGSVTLTNDTIGSTDADALAVDERSNATVTSLRLSSATVSFDATDVAIDNTPSPPPGPASYRNASAFFDVTGDGSLTAFELGYDESAVEIDENALRLWRYDGSEWHAVDADVDASQGILAADEIDEPSTFGAFGSGVDSIDAAETTATTSESGELVVAATDDAGDPLEGVPIEVTADGGLSGLSTGDTEATDENGTATFTFDEADPGEYDVGFAWQADNTSNDTATVTVSNPSSGGSSSDDPPSSTPSRNDDDDETDEDRVDVETHADGSVSATVSASASEPVSVDLGDLESRYERVDITFVEDTNATVSARSTGPEELPEGTPLLFGDGSTDLGTENASEPGRATSYVEFTVTSGDVDASDRIRSATVQFELHTDTLEVRGVDAENIALHRYDADAGEWTQLDTVVLSEGEGTVTYESITPGFSTFAVGTVDRQSSPDESPSDGSTAEQTSDETGDGENGGAESEGQSDRDDTDDSTGEGFGFGISIALLALAGIALLAIRNRR
ncbi:PKD domain-containing protein [Natrinema saccharevitans]|uniref:PKD domain-containing protein n=1 Tax=Natrinema saccharevitans TaxID=301967 RepID=UPI0011158E8F|nr:PKD domain-containing protein [Natrinema saccharevitans]